MAYGGQSSPEGSLLLANFECSICLQIFTRPKILPCGHTFCMECLVPLAKGSNSVKCPTCQTSVKLFKGGRAGVEALIDNFSVANLREDASRHRQTRGPHGLENPVAVRGTMCPKHLVEELRCYCPRCDAVICEECMFEDHNTHGVNRLRNTLQQQTAKAREMSEEAKRLMKQIRGKITELENWKKNMALKKNVQAKAVDEAAEKLMSDFASKVKRRATALKFELDNFFVFSNNLMMDRKELLETQLAQLASSVEALEQSVNQRETIAVLSGRKMLKGLIEQSAKEIKKEFYVEAAVFMPNRRCTLPESNLGKVEVLRAREKIRSSTPPPRPPPPLSPPPSLPPPRGRSASL
ncbi:tripartite motif-containing protein 3-like [Branchiostoma floridae x Branchiostoma belcheri]